MGSKEKVFRVGSQMQLVCLVRWDLLLFLFIFFVFAHIFVHIFSYFLFIVFVHIFCFCSYFCSYFVHIFCSYFLFCSYFCSYFVHMFCFCSYFRILNNGASGCKPFQAQCWQDRFCRNLTEPPAYVFWFHNTVMINYGLTGVEVCCGNQHWHFLILVSTLRYLKLSPRWRSLVLKMATCVPPWPLERSSWLPLATTRANQAWWSIIAFINFITYKQKQTRLVSGARWRGDCAREATARGSSGTGHQLWRLPQHHLLLLLLVFLTILLLLVLLVSVLLLVLLLLRVPLLLLVNVSASWDPPISLISFSCDSVWHNMKH